MFQVFDVVRPLPNVSLFVFQEIYHGWFEDYRALH